VKKVLDPNEPVITVVVQWGNTDDKLSQRAWHHFCGEVTDLLQLIGVDQHFLGYSQPNEWWQNACAVINVRVHDISELRHKLALIATAYKQDSIALTIGRTEFVEATL